MTSMLDTLLSDIPRLAGLGIALSAAVVAITTYLRRHGTSVYAGAKQRSLPVPRAVTYQDAPTIRRPDAHRLDRQRKLIRLAPGEHVDVLENLPGMPRAVPRFRITLKSVLRPENDSPAAYITVEFGGAAVSCGPLVEETGFNEFVLPRASRDDARNCVFHYQENGDTLEFMRIKLRGVDMDADIAEIDVMRYAVHDAS